LHSLNHNPVTPPDGLSSTLSVRLPDEAATQRLGRLLAPLLQPGMVVWLNGDLGAGKTTLTRALLRGLGYAGLVKSPTYTLVEVYVVSSLYFYHFDFYRFNEPEEFDDAGLGDYFRSDAVCLVEWPEKAAGFVPAADLALDFRFADASPEAGRDVDLVAHGEAGHQCLSALKNLWPAAAN
jgi:tRNA threonylcarbamoyladenosine biosynthesis protein TsaE